MRCPVPFVSFLLVPSRARILYRYNSPLPMPIPVHFIAFRSGVPSKGCCIVAWSRFTGGTDSVENYSLASENPWNPRPPRSSSSRGFSSFPLSNPHNARGKSVESVKSLGKLLLRGRSPRKTQCGAMAIGVHCMWRWSALHVAMKCTALADGVLSIFGWSAERQEG